ncbi:hypothetical protein FACS1894216_12890 [Synergistales bacterium]|nr:hypothetical protein FACS1894216_12890 [Synergistales bacterium]
MDNKYTVGIARCESYERGEVSAAAELAVARAGGLPETPSEAALIKTNMLSPAPPDCAVTTHPEVLRSLSLALINMGKSVKIADNPGYIFTNAEKLCEVTGVTAIAQSIGGVEAGLLSARGARTVRKDSFVSLKEARIWSDYLDAGYVINAAKLKTHVETEISSCVKNIFGTADTDTRKRAHSSTSETLLAEAIVDLFTIRPPEFNVLDAIISMEGDGPSHGKPRHTGWILAGRNALSIDWAAATIMCYDDPLKIPLIKAAVKRNIGPRDISEIDLVGADWSDLPSRGFKKSSSAMRILPTFIRGFAHRFISLTPRLIEKQCVKCGICARVCPVDAIKCDPASYPKIDASLCVKCLCCHEMCPAGAMTAHKNFIASIASRMRGE